MIDGIQGSSFLPSVAPPKISDGETESLLRAAASDDPEKLKQVASQLEGVFVSMLVENLRKSMSEEGLFGDGPGADTYGGFFDRMMGDEIAESGGLGIADMVLRARIERGEGGERDASRNGEPA